MHLMRIFNLTIPILLPDRPNTTATTHSSMTIAAHPAICNTSIAYSDSPISPPSALTPRTTITTTTTTTSSCPSSSPFNLTLSNLHFTSYKALRGAHQISHSSINFNLTDPETGEMTKCGTYASLPDEVGRMDKKSMCNDAMPGSGEKTKTMFTWSMGSESGTLMVWREGSCGGEGTEKHYNVKGQMPLTKDDCTHTVTQEEQGSMGFPSRQENMTCSLPMGNVEMKVKDHVVADV